MPGCPGYRAHNRVFSDQQEASLCQYLLKAADIYFGLSPKEVRRFAYQLGQKYDCVHPAAWNTKKMAGKDWFSSFMERNPTLSIRQPQAISLSWATSFNPNNVARFFGNLTCLMVRYGFQPEAIWNMDETSTVTVQTPSRIIAAKGKKQVAAMTSAERGALVTLAMAVNALGNHIPPHFIFPRKKYFNNFVHDGPRGCIGTANGSGWMQKGDFVTFLHHFKKHSNAFKESPQLLLLNNHSSHLSLQGIEFCRENGIVLLSFPPHCSHKLQPLDRSVYGPLKRYINTTMDLWLKMHPGRTITIYDLPSIVATALPAAATPANIMSGFSCTGIWLLDPHIFKDADFSPAFVTDRPAPTITGEPATPVEPGVRAVDPGVSPAAPMEPGVRAVDPGVSPAAPLEPGVRAVDPGVSPAAPMAEDGAAPVQSGDCFSPVAVHPFPKAGPRIEGTRRRRRTTAILTDTPVKRALEEEKKKKSPKAKQSLAKRMGKKKNKTNKNHKKKGENAAGLPHGHGSGDNVECMVCGEDFDSSVPGESWIRCLFCQEWAH
ncbi:hypothetical protein SKAU_G00429850 [Synaphobranchus kaupii]|uniref:DDE-1 domain-containing protein n=1 Tax=Synaphobranchus kaupii TaxID=118154 RepID=A0A9Q1E4D1_SYNKA|nr:hypothetical protein SKAU_G00429850 [Synaphobranchus kaupii]